MTSRSGQIDARGFAVVARGTMAACAVFLLVPALAQEARPPAEIPSQNAGAAAANPPTAVPNSMPGPSLVDTIGRWFDDGTTQFKSNLQGAQQSFDQLRIRRAMLPRTRPTPSSGYRTHVLCRCASAVRWREAARIATRQRSWRAEARGLRPARASTPSRSRNARRRSCSAAARPTMANVGPRHS
jgi:hypothetical protein